MVVHEMHGLLCCGMETAVLCSWLVVAVTCVRSMGQGGGEEGRRGLLV